jgi:hypothetical protein
MLRNKGLAIQTMEIQLDVFFDLFLTSKILNIEEQFIQGV